MRYAVDLIRDVYYAGRPEYSKVVLEPLGYNLIVIGAMFMVFVVIGTLLFVKKESNR